MVESPLPLVSFLLALLGLLFGARADDSAPAGAAPERAPRAWHLNADASGLFLGGHDVVAYHLDGEAKVGDAAHEVEHRGLRLRFTSEEHVEAFREDPAFFLPAWGGWCALFLAIDPDATGQAPRRIPVDPTCFLVEDGRLLLFARGGGFDARARWLRGAEDSGASEARRQRGDAFWASREALAAEFPELPEGMNPLAPMETAQLAALMGDWDAEYTFRRGRASEARTTLRATWAFRFAWDGFAVIDEWRQIDGLPGNSGPALRSFDPLGRVWTNHYVPVNAPMGAAWHFESTFDETGMHGELEQSDPDGTPFRTRIHFRDIRRDSFTWSCDRSYDGGETWIEDWGVGRQRRATER